MFSTFLAYQIVYMFSILLVTYLGVSTINQETLYTKDEESTNFSLWAFVIFIIIGSGLRRTNGGGFGDTGTYVAFFNLAASMHSFHDFSGEWFWTFLMYACSKIGGVSLFFLVVAIAYMSCHVIACQKLIKGRSDLLIIGCLCAFSFLSYSMNGIRNGLACAMIILAISFVLDRKNNTDLYIAGGLSIFAYFIHHSVALPILAMFVCSYYKNTEMYIYFWFLSIPISLIAGSQIEAFFGGLGFDDRMASYSEHNYDYLFSHTGFRWDFLLYSFMPILLGYYITFKQSIQDDKYSFLLNTYIVCNAFWVMVIRTSSSNRFAYLSWFLYPIVLIYPLLSFPIFNEDNDRKVSYIIMAHTAFTFFMWTIGK